MRFNFIDTNTEAELKSFSAAAEAAKQLLPEQLEIIYANKWFKMFVPEKFGGRAMSLPDALRLEEDLARIDGSLGWTITLCAGAGLFSGYIQPSFAEKIFYNEKACLGGSGASSGIAQVLEDGYLINGFWQYATGTPYLTHFTASCKLEKDGSLLSDENGAPVIRSFIFKREEVTIHKEWSAMGLKATASHSFEVKNLKVGEEQLFTIGDKNIFRDEPLYRYPFLQFAATTIAVNSLGMAEHFLDEVFNEFDKKLKAGNISEKEFESAMRQVNFAGNFLEKNKEQLYAKVEESWKQLLTANQIEPELLQTVSFLSKGLARSARELITDIYPLCGLSATKHGSVLNRILRDIFTASQHSLLTF